MVHSRHGGSMYEICMGMTSNTCPSKCSRHLVVLVLGKVQDKNRRACNDLIFKS